MRICDYSIKKVVLISVSDKGNTKAFRQLDKVNVKLLIHICISCLFYIILNLFIYFTFRGKCIGREPQTRAKI